MFLFARHQKVCLGRCNLPYDFEVKHRESRDFFFYLSLFYFAKSVLSLISWVFLPVQRESSICQYWHLFAIRRTFLYSFTVSFFHLFFPLKRKDRRLSREACYRSDTLNQKQQHQHRLYLDSTTAAIDLTLIMSAVPASAAVPVPNGGKVTSSTSGAYPPATVPSTAHGAAAPAAPGPSDAAPAPRKSSSRKHENESNPDFNLTAIGNYTFSKTLGQGNFAKVKLAKHKLTGLEVTFFYFHFAVSVMLI